MALSSGLRESGDGVDTWRGLWYDCAGERRRGPAGMRQKPAFCVWRSLSVTARQTGSFPEGYGTIDETLVPIGSHGVRTVVRGTPSR